MRVEKESTNHHLIGVQQLYPFWVSLMRKTLPTLPLLSGGLLITYHAKAILVKGIAHFVSQTRCLIFSVSHCEILDAESRCPNLMVKLID